MIKLTSILVEGRYSKIVSDWTKEIVKIIKSFLSSKKDYLLKTLNKQLLDRDVEITIEFNKLKDIETWEISGIIFDDNTIGINIAINPEVFPKKFNEIIGAIKGMIRHEIEHFTQFYLKGKPVPKSNFEKTGGSFLEYLLSPEETAAYWHQFLEIAKNRKKAIDNVMLNFLNKQKSRLGSDYNKVKKQWLKYGKKNFPNAKWSF